jgi:hypothetical protein
MIVLLQAKQKKWLSAGFPSRLWCNRLRWQYGLEFSFFQELAVALNFRGVPIQWNGEDKVGIAMFCSGILIGLGSEDLFLGLVAFTTLATLTRLSRLFENGQIFFSWMQFIFANTFFKLSGCRKSSMLGISLSGLVACNVFLLLKLPLINRYADLDMTLTFSRARSFFKHALPCATELLPLAIGVGVSTLITEDQVAQYCSKRPS